MSERDDSNPFSTRPPTESRLQEMGEEGYLVVVTRAFGPDGEDLMAYDGPKFSGAPGIKLLVRQGDIEDEVFLSPYYGDPDKKFDAPFEEGKPCELLCPESEEPLDKIPGMTSDDGGEYFAIYLTPRLKDGELVAVNNVWGNTNSRIMSEDEMLLLLAEGEEEPVQ